MAFDPGGAALNANQNDPGGAALNANQNDSGGYDPEMFIDQKDAKEYTCALCQYIMKEPTDIGCGNEHSYCKTCVDEFYEKGSSNRCPKCSQDLKKEEIELDDDKYGEILMLKVKCLTCKNWEGRLANYKKHLKKECNKENDSATTQAGLNSIFSLANLNIGGSNANLSNTFQIFVRTLEGRDIVFNNVSGKDTVHSLQLKIQDKEGIPVEQQRLVYHGRNLDVRMSSSNNRDALLEDYKVRDQSCINLVKRLKGGK